MSGYIEREALKGSFMKYNELLPFNERKRRPYAEPVLFLSMVMDEIDSQPTADVVEVKHGEWIKDRLCSTSGGTYGVRRCSVCEDYYQDIGYGWNYCPNCGAKMDERREDDKG